MSARPGSRTLVRMLTFITASLILIMIPGPDQALITRNALAGGAAAGEGVAGDQGLVRAGDHDQDQGGGDERQHANKRPRTRPGGHPCRARNSPPRSAMMSL